MLHDWQRAERQCACQPYICFFFFLSFSFIHVHHVATVLAPFSLHPHGSVFPESFYSHGSVKWLLSWIPPTQLLDFLRQAAGSHNTTIISSVHSQTHQRARVYERLSAQKKSVLKSLMWHRKESRAEKWLHSKPTWNSWAFRALLLRLNTG